MFIAGNEVHIIGGSELHFTGTMLSHFTTILAIDDDFSDGTRLARLCIRAINGIESSVPVEIYPSSIQVQVIDNDGNEY